MLVCPDVVDWHSSQLIGLLSVMRPFPFMAALTLRRVYVLSGTLAPSVGRLQQLERHGGGIKTSFLLNY